MTPPGARGFAFAAASPLDHVFYPAMAVLLAAAVASGFAPTFFARDVAYLGPLPLPAFVHGVIGTAWVLSFAAQTALVATRRFAWHRRFGFATAGLGVAFVASGIAVMAALERSHGLEPLAWRAPHVFTNLAPLVAFATFVAAGVVQRARAAQHKRLMLLAAVVLLPPAIGRLFAAHELAQLNLAVYASFAFANTVYDVLVYRRPHAVSLLGAAALVAIDVTTTAWLAAVGS